MYAAAQVYPKMFLRGGTMYDTAWWGWLVRVWEVVVYNQLLDLQQCWQVQLSACCFSATPCPVILLYKVPCLKGHTITASGAHPAPLYDALTGPHHHRSCCRWGRCCSWEQSGTTDPGGGAGRGRRSRLFAAAPGPKMSGT